MLRHADIWRAIDRLAADHGLSPSGLARRAGLDATTFNKSKRATRDGKKRWPSTESLAKVLEACGASLADFVALVGAESGEPLARRIPVIGYAQAGAAGYFDDAGYPTQLSAALLAGEVDAALVAEPVAESRFESVVAFEEEPVIVTTDDCPMIDGDTPKTMIVFEHGCPHRQRLEAWYTARKETPERIIELGSYHAMLGCVLAGMGAALLPKSVLQTFPESKRLRIHSLPRGKDRIRTLLIWRKGVTSPKVTALAEILTAGNRRKPKHTETGHLRR